MLQFVGSQQSDMTEGLNNSALLHCWWECKLILLWKTVWRFLKKLGINLPYDLAIPLLGIPPEETKSEKDTCTLVFTAALFTIARTWKPRVVHQKMNG